MCARGPPRTTKACWCSLQNEMEKRRNSACSFELESGLPLTPRSFIHLAAPPLRPSNISVEVCAIISLAVQPLRTSAPTSSNFSLCLFLLKHSTTLKRL